MHERAGRHVPGESLRAYLIEDVKRDRIKHVLNDDSKNRVRSALSFPGAGNLVLSGDRNLIVRIL